MTPRYRAGLPGFCRLTTFTRIAVSAVAALAVAALPVRAEDLAPLPAGKPEAVAPAPRPVAATVTVEFEGGLVGQEMAKVIESFGQEPDLLPARLHLPAETVGLCGVLESELQVPSVFCTRDLLDAVVAFNKARGRAVDPDRVGGGVLLPDVATTETAVVRLYNQSRPDEAKQIEQRTRSLGWSPSILGVESDVLAKTGIANGAPQIDALTVKRHTWTFPVPTDDAGLAASYIGLDLDSPNLSVSVEFNKPAKKEFNSYPADDHFVQWCDHQTAVPMADGVYADMVESLYETADAVACTGGPSRPSVAIMDQRITAQPDIAASLSDDPATALPPPVDNAGRLCSRGTFETGTDHGTLLASIVAASSNNLGFLGLAPNARIRSFVWDGDKVGNGALQSFILETDKPTDDTAPGVFLFASRFQPLIEFPPSGLAPHLLDKAEDYWRRSEDGAAFERLLAHSKSRFAHKLVREILQRKFLLVASAGNRKDGGIEIDWEKPIAPQNLGDDDNVLIVGACTECDGPDATLWEQSNRSKPGAGFVAILAPGDGIVPTYVSPDKVAATVGGTSSAAAFVAGLAARMASCYPASYLRQPENLKARLVLASRPTHRLTQPEPARTVEGGIVDPAVSMLDPAKDWLKLQGEPVRSVAFDHWCDTDVEWETEPGSGLNRRSDLPGTHRLTALDGMGLVRQTVSDPDRNEITPMNRRSVHREPPRWPKPDDVRLAAVTDAARGQCAVTANRLGDLFLSQVSAERQEVATCEALEPCE